MIDLGDGRVMVIGAMMGGGLGSGARVNTDWSAVFTTSAGWVIREQEFRDNDEALEAVGLRE